MAGACLWAAALVLGTASSIVPNADPDNPILTFITDVDRATGRGWAVGMNDIYFVILFVGGIPFFTILILIVFPVCLAKRYQRVSYTNQIVRPSDESFSLSIDKTKADSEPRHSAGAAKSMYSSRRIYFFLFGKSFNGAFLSLLEIFKVVNFLTIAIDITDLTYYVCERPTILVNAGLP